MKKKYKPEHLRPLPVNVDPADSQSWRIKQGWPTTTEGQRCSHISDGLRCEAWALEGGYYCKAHVKRERKGWTMD